MVLISDGLLETDCDSSDLRSRVCFVSFEERNRGQKIYKIKKENIYWGRGLVLVY